MVGFTKPAVGVPINWGHPLARGLTVAEFGSWKRPVLVGDTGRTYGGSIAIGDDDSVLLTTGADYLAHADAQLWDDVWASPRGFTIVSRFRCDIAHELHLLTRDSDAGVPGSAGAGRHWQWRMNTNGTLQWITFANGGVAKANFGTAAAYNDSRWHVAAAVVDYSFTTDNAAIWVDGTRQAVASDDGVHTTGITANVLTGARTVGATRVTATFVWQRPLTPDEIARLAAEPYAFLAPRPALITHSPVPAPQTLALSPVSIQVTPEPFGITTAVTIPISPAVVPIVAETLGVATAVTIALAPASVLVLTETFGVTTAVTVPLSPATIQVLATLLNVIVDGIASPYPQTATANQNTMVTANQNTMVTANQNTMATAEETR